MPPSEWHFADFRLDATNACLWRGTAPVALPPKAFDLLAYLLAHRDRLVPKDELLDALWPETAVSDAGVRVLIGALRKVLGDTARTPQFIATVPRRGYRFIATVTHAERRVEEGRLGSASSSPRPSARLGSSAPIRLLVERETALDRLHVALAQARQGQRQVLFLTGEPGIGKTAVVETFIAHVSQESAVEVAVGQCIEHYGTGEPYLPFLEALGQLCRGMRGERVVTLLRQYAPTWLMQLPWLLTPADRATLQHEGRGVTRERMLRELAELLATLTTEDPLIVVLEDLHWSDHATLDALAWLARRREPARVVLVGTYRPVETVVSHHPLRQVAHDLQLHGQSTEIPLAPLSPGAIAAYLAARCPGGGFPPALIQWLSQCTEGNPLFLVEVVTHLIAHDVLVARGEQWVVQRHASGRDIEIPATLREMIALQCARLAPVEQHLLAVASVAGVEFTAAAVATGLDDEVAFVEAHCEAFVYRGQVLRALGVVEWPDGTVTARYVFQHALYQQVVYEQLGAVRQVYLHRQLGTRLEQAYGAHTAAIATELAEHFVRGREVERAIPYLWQAADTARSRHALHEALAHLTRALDLLGTLPETTARHQQELTLQVARGEVLMITCGAAAPAVQEAYSRAYTLCQQAEDTASLLPILAGLQRFAMVRASHQQSLELGERLLRLAERLQEPTSLLEAHGALGATRRFLGQFAPALAHQEEVLVRYAPRWVHRVGISQDLKVAGLASAAHLLWCLGFPDQALRRGLEAVAVAQQLGHPYSLMWCQQFVADLYQWRGAFHAAQQVAEASLTLATTQGFQLWAAQGTLRRGVLRARRGNLEGGIADMQQGLEAMRTTGAVLTRAYFLIHLAEAHLHRDQPTAGLGVLTEALTLMETTSECWWEAEAHRVHGELCLGLVRGRDPEPGVRDAWRTAEACFDRALTIARSQDAKSLELRAALSLSRLWQQQGKCTAATAVLAPLYAWFTEGLETADLQEAKALLEVLA